MTAPPVITLPWTPTRDPAWLREREWLITNGLGGYASGTLLNVNTRRYHGVFIPNLPTPRGRTVMIPRLADEVVTEQRSVLLGGAEYGDGRCEGEVANVLTEFRHECQTPVWTFAIDERRIEKRLLMPHGHNTVYIVYRLVEGEAVQLRLRPYFSCRQHGASLVDPSTQDPFPLTILRDQYEVHFGESCPSLRICLRPHGGIFIAEEHLCSAVLYRVDRDRGMDAQTTLHSPGYLTTTLTTAHAVALVASVEPWELLEAEVDRIVEAEHQRVKRVLSLAPPAAHTGFLAQLVLAADQFIILPGTRPEEQMLAHTAGEEARTIVAGYHWFTDWGRDTMISLEGLTLCTGRRREARAILQTFAHYVKSGLLPNHFPEGERAALYNTVDATLWYFHALDRYLQTCDDHDTLASLYPTLRTIIEQHEHGTDFGIGVDPQDGLLTSGAEGFALTWMDAKVGDWVVTPRRGKAVEVQALWYNALRLMALWAQQLGESADHYLALAHRAHTAFNARFWFAPGAYLYDVIDGEQGDDASLRPNQIFSLSLRFPILAQQYWSPVLTAVTTRLLTPVGLRTLEPDHRNYKARYDGDLRSRDAAYHQGTVWPWLIGHFIDAWKRVTPETAQLWSFLQGFEEALTSGGIGTLSEIFDAEPPYHARGCIAQAWSVAEVLRSTLALKSGPPAS